MKKFERYLFMILASIIAINSTFSTNALAIENDSLINEVTYLDITQTSDTIDNTFTMGYNHRGGDRAYTTNKLYVRITITDEYGNPVDNDVTVTFNDYNGNIIFWNLPADGGLHTRTFSIIPNRVYYFEYTRSGTARNLKLHVIITPYNS